MKTTDDQRELLIVVNPDDKIIGYRTRRDCHHDKSLIHRVVGLLIYNKKGQMLLQKRSGTKDLQPGKWGISVGGHVTKGQTYEQALQRETLEELGIISKFTFIKKWIIYSPQETEMSSLYRAINDGPFKTDPKEISEIRFFDIDEIAHLAATGRLELSDCAKITLIEIGILPRI